MNELRHAINQIAWVFVDSEDLANALTDSIMEILEPTIFDERRAAAVDMRERCASTVQGWHISKGGYNALAHELRNLPLDSDGGA